MPDLRGPKTADVVMKFGGSSLASAEHIERVADIVAQRAKTDRVVVVVSAMGKTTDALVEQARALCPDPHPRELDMLLTTGERQSMAMVALAVHARGAPAISLTGSQVGIITDHQHGRARVVEVRPFRIADELDAGSRVVVVGGFQGVSYKREVTTLGRGGSDTTAVALAAALGADCEIYSDVPGVLSADPRVVEAPRLLPEVDYDTMRTLSREGARVLHSNAVELAATQGVVIRARATNGEAGQTTIHDRRPATPAVVSVTSDLVRSVRATYSARPPGPPDDIIHLFALSGLGGLSWRGDQIEGTISERSFDDAHERVNQLTGSLSELPHAPRVEVEDDLATVSVVGPDVPHLPDALPASLAALATAGLTVVGATTARDALRLSVPRRGVDEAVRSLHARWIESQQNR